METYTVSTSDPTGHFSKLEYYKTHPNQDLKPLSDLTIRYVSNERNHFIVIGRKACVWLDKSPHLFYNYSADRIHDGAGGQVEPTRYWEIRYHLPYAFTTDKYLVSNDRGHCLINPLEVSAGDDVILRDGVVYDFAYTWYASLYGIPENDLIPYLLVKSRGL